MAVRLSRTAQVQTMPVECNLFAAVQRVAEPRAVAINGKPAVPNPLFNLAARAKTRRR